MELNGVELNEDVVGRKIRVFNVGFMEDKDGFITEGATYEVIEGSPVMGCITIRVPESERGEWVLSCDSCDFCDWEWVEETPEVELPMSDLEYLAHHQRQLGLSLPGVVCPQEVNGLLVNNGKESSESSVEAPQQDTKVKAYERIKAAVDELNGAVRDAKGVSVDTVLSRSHKDSFITITSVTHQPATIVYNNGE